MKFKSGVKVEVMNQADVPISWRTAQILSGDGDTYILRFDSLGESKSVVERVYQSLIRPSPPLVQHHENWLSGDILEVFDDFSWKVAIVVDALNEDYYFVRLIGSSHKLCIHISSMRRRLAWQDGRWDWMPKGSTECGKLRPEKLPNQILPSIVESRVQPSRSCKRAYMHCPSATESHTARYEKQRTLETNRQRQKKQEKEEAVACPRETLGKKFGHASFNIRLTRYNKMDNSCSSPLRSSGLNDSDSDDSCSVGSCSVTSEGLVTYPYHHVPELVCSDAESVCCSGDEEESFSHPNPPEEDLAESIHRLELHAYHCTLEALYASGPLTWEQETMLTNLRIALHISNDEHLTELKNLISAKSCSYYTRQ